jgi:hypothetical protein
MQGADLLQYFDHFSELKKYCDGIFSIDTIPKTIKFRHFLICNTDVKSGKGMTLFRNIYFT